MQKIVVSDKIFKTKKECKNYTQKLLYTILSENQVKPVKVCGEKFIFLTELFKRHSEYSTKVGLGVKEIYVSYGLGGGPLVEILTSAEKYDTISWNRCCSGVPQTERNKITDRYRREIAEDVIAFRRSVPPYCLKCRSTKKLQVDHCGDNEFKDIVNKFQASSSEEKSIGFREFHKKLATYQLLCIECHIRK